MASNFLNFPTIAQIEEEKQKCSDFIGNYTVGADYRKYMEQLQEVAGRERITVEILLSDIRLHLGEEFEEKVRSNTTRYVRFFEEAIDALVPTMPLNENEPRDVIDVLQSIHMATFDQLPEEERRDLNMLMPPKKYTRRYEISIMHDTTEPIKKLREVKAADIGRLVRVKGMVTRASDVKAHINVLIYMCDACGAEIYTDIAAPVFMPLDMCPSQRCKDMKSKGTLHQMTRGSRFSKYQELRLQELPDQVPVGHIPRSMTVKCRGEQTRHCGPGDIVTISGVFVTTKARGYKAMRQELQAETFLEAMSIDKQKKGYGDIEIDEETERLVRSIAKDPDPYGRLAKSIAPEIFGHEDVKKALLLQLISGSTRVLPDGMKIRGDINICLMGDPGVAKSQLLKYIATVAPRGVYTTGKGSSGVGLTAAVVRDPLSGELSLEGGALVLADMGVCCIDEFDKMDENDRTAIHEVMEQQTISIAKAGITTTLNARAAVLAAANPLYGRYNRRKSISENVDLPNSLLSRFDLLFLILDKADLTSDLALSKHVLHVHKFLRNPDQAFTPLSPLAIKQYIAAARTLNPTVPEQLASYIIEAYVDLRVRDASGNAPGATSSAKGNDQNTMTARQLLSILRLSQALARLRLAEVIAHQDVDEAMRLVHSSKSSLLDDARSAAQEDYVSAIWNLMRDYTQIHNTTSISYNLVEAMVLNTGYTVQQLKTCLNEYSNLGVIEANMEAMIITFYD